MRERGGKRSEAYNQYYGSEDTYRVVSRQVENVFGEKQVVVDVSFSLGTSKGKRSQSQPEELQKPRR
jgi:hypothetical protein